MPPKGTAVAASTRNVSGTPNQKIKPSTHPASPSPARAQTAAPRPSTARVAKSVEGNGRLASKSPVGSPAGTTGRKKSKLKDVNAPVHNLSFGHPPATVEALYVDSTSAVVDAEGHGEHLPAAAAQPAVCPTLALYGEIASRSNPDDVSSESAGQCTSALFTIGWMYHFGLGGCPISKKKSYAYFYAAARRGDALAKYYVGLQQLRGDGTRKDPSAALEYLLESAAGGVDVAAFAAGKILLDGIDGHVAVDRAKAIELLEQAEKMNNVPAINKMSSIRSGQAEQHEAAAAGLSNPEKSVQ